VDPVIVAGREIDGREATPNEPSRPVGIAHQIDQVIIQPLGLEERSSLMAPNWLKAPSAGQARASGSRGAGRASARRARVKKALKLG
jgi:hypothetical protein